MLLVHFFVWEAGAMWSRSDDSILAGRRRAIVLATLVPIGLLFLANAFEDEAFIQDANR